MVRLEALSAEEREVLDSCHAGVRARLLPLVRPETRPFLLAQTRPLAER